MKNPIRLLIVSLAAATVLGGLILAYLQMRKERDREAAAETPVAAPSLMERDQTGAPQLILDAAIEERLGLRKEVPATGWVERVVLASGRVLDGATLTGQLHEIGAAQAALEAARLDYERKHKLFDNGQNASAAAVEAADALAKQNQLALDSARDRLTANWGVNLAKRDDLQALAQSLLVRQAALVRVELLATAKLAGPPETVRLLRQNEEELATARVLGPALRADSPVIGLAYLALVTSNATALVPGSSLLAHLAAGPPDGGVVLPRDAVVRQRGQGWVYAETAPHIYTRRPVPLDQPHPDGWLVPGQWTQPVVVSGAQSLLSEELKGSIRMRD